MRTQFDLFRPEEAPAAVKPPREAEQRWVVWMGYIWEPGIGLCWMSRDLDRETAQSLLGAGCIDRDKLVAWIEAHGHDFREIVDFTAKIGQHEIDWSLEESAERFNLSLEDETC